MVALSPVRKFRHRVHRHHPSSPIRRRHPSFPIHLLVRLVHHIRRHLHRVDRGERARLQMAARFRLLAEQTFAAPRPRPLSSCRGRRW